MKRPYYICSSGRLKRRQNTVYFESFPSDQPDPAVADEELLAGFTEETEKDDSEPVKRKPILVEDIEAFYCLGELDFNSKFFNFLSQHKIPLHLFNYYGYYSGSFMPRDYLPSGHTVVEQVRAYLDPHRRLVLAREFVDGASFNILKNLQYYSNRGDTAWRRVAFCKGSRISKPFASRSHRLRRRRSSWASREIFMIGITGVGGIFSDRSMLWING
jgi:CRISPR-associated protein Cas1